MPSFINLSDDIGTLLISPFFNSDSNYSYNLDNAILEIESNGFKCEVKDISIYKSLVYAVNYKDEKIYQYRFEFGYKNKRLFVTLTFENNNKNSLEYCYDKATKILNTIKFK